jgi:integrase
MHDLTYSVVRTCKENRDGSFSTISARKRTLVQAADQLHELGFKGMKQAKQLKPKHVWALVSHWKTSGVTSATMKNRMSHLRWLAGKTNNDSLVAKDNSYYEIDKRSYVTNVDKSVVFDEQKVAAIFDPHIRLSAELQKHFGLRREEAMKFIVAKADKEHEIQLQGSWTKGGKPRTIPIRNEAQRELLNRVHKFCGNGSLIPSNRTYVQHQRLFEKEMHSVGLGRTHGARHLYAQDRYFELSGRLAPAKGGLRRKEMSESERKQDDEFRLTISRELGHERIAIVAVYIGS